MTEGKFQIRARKKGRFGSVVFDVYRRDAAGLWQSMDAVFWDKEKAEYFVREQCTTYDDSGQLVNEDKPQ